MRPKIRPAQLAAGMIMLAIPASAVALAAGQADAQSALQISLNSRHIAYGENLKVTGTASPANAGQAVALQIRRAGTSGWQTVDSTKVGPHGHFTFAEPIKQSGLVRAVSTATRPRGASPLTGSTPSATIAPSVSRPFEVASSFRVRGRSIDALAGQTVDVRGRLVPERGGRRVFLEGRSGRHWHWLATHPHRPARRLPPALPHRKSREPTAAGPLRRRPAEHPRDAARRARHRVPCQCRVLVQRRRRDGLWFPCRLRRCEPHASVRHQGQIPLRRAHGHGGRR